MDACLLHDSHRPDAMTDLQRIRRTHTVRSLAVAILLVVLLVALALSDLVLGHRTYSMSDLIGALLGQGDEGTWFVILQLRMPRALIGCAAGIAFGMAGIGFQHLLRNMMASPDIIGITAGANTAAIFGIVVLGLSGHALGLPGGHGRSPDSPPGHGPGLARFVRPDPADTNRNRSGRRVQCSGFLADGSQQPGG